jgi:hypothetical protein
MSIAAWTASLRRRASSLRGSVTVTIRFDVGCLCDTIVPSPGRRDRADPSSTLDTRGDVVEAMSDHLGINTLSV